MVLGVYLYGAVCFFGRRLQDGEDQRAIGQRCAGNACIISVPSESQHPGVSIRRMEMKTY